MYRSWIWITLCSLCPTVIYGDKVLVFPMDGSHWLNMEVIIEELHARGHQVSVMRLSDSWYIKETSPHYTSIKLEMVSGFDENFTTTIVTKLLQIQRAGKSAWTLLKLAMEQLQKASELHEKSHKMLELIFENKDLIRSLLDAKYDLVLADPVMPWGVLVAHYLKLPLVLNVGWTSQAPDLWLMRVDFVFEFPRPTMPNVVYMGGFQCKPAKPLPEHLEEFVQSSGEHGVVIMSLGTLIGELPHDLADEIAAAFAKLPQKVIGVPIVGLPLIFDQPDNLFRIEVRGAGKIIDIFSMNEDIFFQGIQEVLNEPSYRLNMQRLSRLHRDQTMKPLDTALFWIEFVMRHKGAAHLRTESYRLPWYSYHSVDMLLFLVGVGLIILGTFAALLRSLCSLCLRRKSQRELKKSK